MSNAIRDNRDEWLYLQEELRRKEKQLAAAEARIAALQAERERLRRMVLDMHGCLECGCWENEILALKEETVGE